MGIAEGADEQCAVHSRQARALLERSLGAVELADPVLGARLREDYSQRAHDTGTKVAGLLGEELSLVFVEHSLAVDNRVAKTLKAALCADIEVPVVVALVALDLICTFPGTLSLGQQLAARPRERFWLEEICSRGLSPALTELLVEARNPEKLEMRTGRDHCRSHADHQRIVKRADTLLSNWTRCVVTPTTTASCAPQRRDTNDIVAELLARGEARREEARRLAVERVEPGRVAILAFAARANAAFEEAVGSAMHHLLSGVVRRASSSEADRLRSRAQAIVCDGPPLGIHPTLEEEAAIRALGEAARKVEEVDGKGRDLRPLDRLGRHLLNFLDSLCGRTPTGDRGAKEVRRAEIAMEAFGWEQELRTHVEMIVRHLGLIDRLRSRRQRHRIPNSLGSRPRRTQPPSSRRRPEPLGDAVNLSSAKSSCWGFLPITARRQRLSTRRRWPRTCT